MIEHINCNGVMLALIVRADFNEPGISFFTPNELSQQLAFMRHPAGKKSNHTYTIRCREKCTTPKKSCLSAVAFCV